MKSIPDDQNAIWSVGTSNKPRITLKTLETLIHAASLREPLGNEGWRPIDINTLSIGDRIKYRDGECGEILNIVEKVIDGINYPSDENFLHKARFFVRMDNGGERYYTHRADGVCMEEASTDIVSKLPTPPSTKPEEKE